MTRSIEERLMQKFRLNNWCSILLLPALGLGGCFHDSSSDSDSSAHISGVVSKGITIGARVDAYAIINGVVVDNVSLGHDITDGNGKYSITITTPHNGPAAVVMSPVGDNSSKVKCDVPDGCTVDGSSYNFGNLMPMTFSMEALVPKVAGGGNISASITPLTYMAAAYAKDLGLGAASIEAANEKVARLLDIDDILTVEPVDVTDDAQLGSNTTSLASIKYGYLAASVAAIANSDEGDGDIASTLTILASSYVANSGQLLNNEASSNDDNISLKELTDGANAILNAESDVSGGTFGLAQSEIQTLNTDAAGAAPDTTTDTEVNVAVSTDDIATAKAMVEELRTWGDKLETDLTSGGDKFAGKLETIGSLNEEDIEAVVGGTVFGVAAMTVAYSTEQTDTLPSGTYTLSELAVEMDILDVEVSGLVTVSGQNVSISGGNFDGATLNMSATMPVTTGTTFSVSIDSSTVSNDAAEMKINPSSASVTFGESVDLLAIAEDETETMELPTPTKVALSLDVSLGHVETSTITDPVTFSGKLAGSMLVSEMSGRNDGETENANPESLTMEGIFSTASGDSFSAKFEAEMSNATTFVPVDDLDGELLYASGDDENEDMWRDINGSLTVTADYEDYPPAEIKLSADRTNYEGFSASFQISYDDVSIVAQGSIDATEDEDNPDLDVSIILTTKAGNKLEIYPSIGLLGVRGAVKVNGNIIGVIKESRMNSDVLVVEYHNGDIETVNI